MIIRAYIEQLLADINAGSSTIAMKWNYDQILDEVPSLRQQAIIDKYNGNKYTAAQGRIEGIWVQKFELDIDLSIQDPDADHLILDCPAPIVINNTRTGFIYIGNKNSTDAFFIAQSRNEIDTLKKRNFINNGKNIVAMYSDKQLQIYGDAGLKKVYFEMIMADPLQKPGFNINTDDYPISPSLWSMMIDEFKRRKGIAIAQVKDPILDGADTTTLRQLKSNIL